MKLYKRPEKELDPNKKPGQIVYRPPHFEKPLEKQIEEFKDHPPSRHCSCLNCRDYFYEG